jgi:hypothetical protein
MEKFIKESWFNIGLLVILIFSIAGAFYWFSWRPTQIKQRCSADARLGGLAALSRSRIEINAYYEDCLMRFGLK